MSVLTQLERNQTFLELSATAGGDVEEAAYNLLWIKFNVICSGLRTTQYDRLKSHPWADKLQIKLVGFQFFLFNVLYYTKFRGHLGDSNQSQ